MRHAHFSGHARCDGQDQHPTPAWFSDCRAAIGRRRGGGVPIGGSPFGGGAGGFGGFGGDDAMPRGRQFSADDLQLMLLALIAEQPSHGYELIKAIETRSNGFYSPSPGMIYPALTYLDDVGFVASQAEGNRKRYALTDVGRAHLDAQRERVDTLLARLTHLARKMDFMRRAFAGEAGDESSGGWLPEFVEARVALKHALLHKSGANPDEQRRIAAILRHATAEIEGRTDA